MRELKERLVQIMHSLEDAVSVGDLIEELGDEINAKPSSIRQALAELENKNKIIALPAPIKTGGRPKNVYKLLNDKALEQPITRDIVESLRRERREERQKLLRDLIEDSGGRLSRLVPEEFEAIFLKAATQLMNEDPKILFLRFAEWLKEKYDDELSAFARAKNRGHKSDRIKHEENLKQIERIVYTVFARMLSVPRYLRNENVLRPGPFVLSSDKKSCKNTSNLNRDELSSYLDLSIHGKKVIEKIKSSSLKPPLHIGGSDASIQPINLGQVLPWYTETADMSIVTAVGVRYDVYSGISDYERYPDPRALAQYERRKAIEEGLLIPPAGALGFQNEMENRIKEAAMDLRQYRKDFELMFEKEPACTIQFRDGRIFPLEHRLSDAIQHGLHGEIVRYSLKTFKNIVNAVGAEDGDTLFCGFVKRPGVDILAPIIMWYIGFGSKDGANKSLDPDMTLREFLAAPEGDSWIVSHLFSALKNLLSKDEVLITFRILRRFQSLEEPYVQNFSPTTSREEWRKRLRHYKDVIVGEDSEDSGYNVISTLCARAAILQFYCSLSGSLDPKYEISLSIPRFEILIPYGELEKLLQSAKGTIDEKKYVERIIAVVYHPGILDKYPDPLFRFPARSPKIFLAPKPVCDAHIAAKAIAQVYRDDFLQLLVKEAKIFWLSRARSFIKKKQTNQL